jgi:hypothetical protein
VIKQRLPPSPIQMIEAYSIQSQKQALVDVSAKIVVAYCSFFKFILQIK